MSEENAKKSERSLKERIDEMRAGYINTQELIRFMDAKLAIIWGLCGAMIVHMGDIFVDLIKKIKDTQMSLTSLLLIIVIMMFCFATVIAFWKTISGIIGRKEQGVTTPLPHVLFPIGNNCDILRFNSLISSRTIEDEFNEVRDQLYSVGKILEIKIGTCRVSILCLVVQAVCAVILFVSSKFMA